MSITFFLEGPQVSPICPVKRTLKIKMSMVHLWNDTSTGKYLKNNLAQCHSVHKNSNMDWPGLRPGVWGWQPVDCLSHGMAFEYSALYTEIQFIPHRKQCMFPLQITISWYCVREQLLFVVRTTQNTYIYCMAKSVFLMFNTEVCRVSTGL